MRIGSIGVREISQGSHACRVVKLKSREHSQVRQRYFVIGRLKYTPLLFNSIKQPKITKFLLDKHYRVASTPDDIVACCKVSGADRDN